MSERRADTIAPRSFTFVNHTGDSILTHERDDDMPTIRSHAMTEVRRRKALASQELKQLKRKARASSIATDSSSSHSSARSSSSEIIACDRTFSNHYSGTAIRLHRQSTDTSQHLHYFIHGFTHFTFPTTYIRFQCDVVRVAASEGNAGLIHALCAVSAIHRALIQGVEISDKSLPAIEAGGLEGTTFLYHKQRAIISLQTNLAKVADIHNRSLLATVAVLLMIESLLGDTAAASIHRSGLLGLVKRYGGTQAPSSFLTSDVLMTDIKSAASSLSRPSMEPRDELMSQFNTLNELPSIPHRADLALLGRGFLTNTMRQHLGSELVPLLRAMQSLIVNVEQNFDMGIDVSRVNGAHFLVMEHQLLSLESNGGADVDRDSRLAECCRIASLIYCNLCLWRWPKNSTLVINLLCHFRTAISLWKPEVLAPEQISIWLWLCYVGSFATSSTVESQFYLKSMQDAVGWLGLRSEGQFRIVLASFFYVDRLMGPHLKDCFNAFTLSDLPPTDPPIL